VEPRVPKILEQEAEAPAGLDEGANSDGTKRSADGPPGGAAAAPKPKLAKLSISLSAPASGSDATAAGAAGAEKASNN
jgi:hypothetical protein